MTGKSTILIVDDLFINREILKDLLEDDYNILEASNGTEAIEKIYKYKSTITVILLDIMMPDIDGFEVMNILKTKGNLPLIPIILITASGDQETEGEGLSLGAVDFITKPFNPAIVKARIATHVHIKNYADNLSSMVDQGIKKLQASWDVAMQTLANVIEYRNLESGEHVKRTQILTRLLLQKMCDTQEYKYAFSDREKSFIIKVSPLHDMGKIGIADNVLLKPGKLTYDEFELIKQHTTIGEKIASEFLQDDNVLYVSYCKEVCRSHHEKWDGTGYPDGLAGEDIPISARIVSVVDVFDALMSDRVYKKAFTMEESVDIIKKDSGIHFDPNITKIFLSMDDVLSNMYKKN